MGYRRTYLQEHGQVLFNYLVLSEKLFSHLNEVGEQAQHLLNTMTPSMAKAAEIAEAAQSYWPNDVDGFRRTVKAEAKEIIFRSWFRGN